MQRPLPATVAALCFAAEVATNNLELLLGSHDPSSGCVSRRFRRARSSRPS